MVCHRHPDLCGCVLIRATTASSDSQSTPFQVDLLDDHDDIEF